MTPATDTDPRRWLEALLAAANAHDIDALVACFSVDYVNETPAHPERGFNGRDQVRRNWEMIFGGVPDITVRSAGTAVEGSTVWAELAMDGTARDGRPHSSRGVVIFTVAGGLARHARFYLETVERGSGDVNAHIDRTVGARPS